MSSDSAERTRVRKPLVEQVGLAVLLFTGVSIAMTWPLVRALGALPVSKLPNATVPIASSWSLWWVAERLPRGLDGLWNAPIFHPATGTFAYSEPMVPLGIAAAPLFWAGLEPSVVYDLVVLACLVLNGMSAWGLLRWLGLRPASALLGGALVITCPFVPTILSVLTLVPLFGVVVTLHAGLALLSRPSWHRGLLLGGALGLTYLMCGHHALFLCLSAVPLAAALVERRHLEQRTAAALLVAAAVCLALVGHQVYVQHEALTAQGFVRTLDQLSSGSGTLRAWTSSAFPAWLPQPGIRAAPGHERGLFPGYSRLALATIAVFWGWRSQRRRLVLGLAGMAVAAGSLSMLPLVSLGDGSPYEALMAVVPGLSRVRAVWRFAAMAHLALTLLAALAADELLGRRARLWTGAGVILAFAAIVELWPAPVPLRRPPDLAEWAPFCKAVEERVGPDEALLHIPDRTAADSDAFWKIEADWMYLQTAHGRRLVNGYSSYAPHDFWSIVGAVSHADGDTLAREIEASGVRWIVVRPSHYRPGNLFPGYAEAWRSTSLDVLLLRRLDR